MHSQLNLDKFLTIPRWSARPVEAYLVVRGAAAEPASQCWGNSPAAWNLYYALAQRESPQRLLALPGEVEANLPRIVRMQFRLHRNSNDWSLAALMCALEPGAFLQRYWRAIAALVNMPRDYKHFYSS